MNESIITGRYAVKAVTVRQLCNMPLTLPPAQTLRGYVFTESVAAGLVNAVKRGDYVPPIVLAEDVKTVEGLASVEVEEKLAPLAAAAAETDKTRREAAKTLDSVADAAGESKERKAAQKALAAAEDAHRAAQTAYNDAIKKEYGAGAAESKVSDGQQRLTTIRRAFERGDLNGSEVVMIAYDGGRTFAESFYCLNQSVPVGKGLTAALGMPDAIRDAVVALAAHKYFRSQAWSRSQIAKTISADFAAAALAIASGWRAPESSSTVCSEWLKQSQKLVTRAAIAKAVKTLDALYSASAPWTDAASGHKGDARTKAREVCKLLRRKGTWIVVFAAVCSGTPAPLAVQLPRRLDLLKPVEVDGTVYTWQVGGGTSGSASNFSNNLHVLAAAALAAKAGLPAEQSAPEKKADADAAAVAGNSAAVALATLGV